MRRTRIILVVVAAVAVCLLYFLPRVVVKNENQLTQPTASNPHPDVSDTVTRQINRYRSQLATASDNEKIAIFADSLADVYVQAGKFDSAALFAERSARIHNTVESWVKAGDNFYEAYTFALDDSSQHRWALKTQEYYNKVLGKVPGNLEVKSKLAMTYVSGPNPMKGISLLREVLQADPQNEFALYNMGMLSFQSGQYTRAVERLEDLVAAHPDHIQGQLLLGVAYKNLGQTDKARTQLEKVKEMDDDPAVAATVDSYLEELK